MNEMFKEFSSKNCNEKSAPLYWSELEERHWKVIYKMINKLEKVFGNSDDVLHKMYDVLISLAVHEKDEFCLGWLDTREDLLERKIHLYYLQDVINQIAFRTVQHLHFPEMNREELAILRIICNFILAHLDRIFSQGLACPDEIKEIYDKKISC